MTVKIKISNSGTLPVVKSGIMAMPSTADGRLVPHLILHTKGDDSLLNLIKIHRDTPPGDVQSQWGTKRFSSKKIFLILNFYRPVELEIAVEFDLARHHHAIDGILKNRAVYLQPGKVGDKLSDDVNAPKLLLEIPARTTFPDWKGIQEKHVRKILKKEGVSRKNMGKAVDDYISLRRDVWGKRMK
ncbi:hypothetical protein AB6D66_16830 [Vibrio pomeroyi]|uniref:Uncharacterized protein n=1 Tax=Vibrio pomeroyi TaxID=198832 RepID=A0ABV4N0B3_9VIBR